MNEAMVLKAQERRDTHTREADRMRRLGAHDRAVYHERCADRWQGEVEFWRGAHPRRDRAL